MLNLILFGPPGAGKGTQSAKLVQKYNLIHLSTGDLLRSEIAEGTDLGHRAKVLMDKGELVPDEVVIGMIRHRIIAHAEAGGFIFDGFPRTVAQAHALDALLAELRDPIGCMISLRVNEDELTRRLLQRGLESGRADDQNEEVIRRRVHEYEAKTMPVAQHYGAQGKLTEIDGIGEIETIFSNICRAIEQDVNVA